MKFIIEFWSEKCKMGVADKQRWSEAARRDGVSSCFWKKYSGGNADVRFGSQPHAIRIHRGEDVHVCDIVHFLAVPGGYQKNNAAVIAGSIINLAHQGLIKIPPLPSTGK